MSMATIKDILLIDPSQEPLVNNGQARLADQTDERVVAELRAETGSERVESLLADL